MVRRSRFVRARRGATLVEMALVMILCVLFLFGIYEFGRYTMVRNLMEHAVQEGARYAVVNTADVTTAQVQDRVDQVLAGQSLHLQGYSKTTSITIFRADANGTNLGPWTDARFGEYIGVRIQGNYRPMLPNLLFLDTNLGVVAQSFMYSEAN